MSTIHGRARIMPDGTLRVPMPIPLAGREVDFTLDVHETGVNGAAAPSRDTTASREDWLQKFDSVVGSIPDFELDRPKAGDEEVREPLC